MTARDDRDRGCEDLLRQAHTGDHAAIAALLEKYLPALDAYVERHTGAALRQKESRADMVQSVCREVLEGLRREAFEYRGEAQFRRWLYDAALHKIQGRARFYAAGRREAAREVPLDELDPQHHPSANTGESPSRELQRGEELARFRAAMQRLDGTARQVVEWAYLEDLPHKEVAARLGITEAHSRMLLSRALARIARLAQEGPS